MEHSSIIDIILHDISLFVVSTLVILLNNQRLKTERLKNELEYSKRQLEVFMNMVAHDLMQPIAIIKLYVESFIKTTKGKENNLSKNLISALNTFTHLASDLRDAARIGKDQFVLSPVKMDFCELIRDIVIQEQITTSRHKIYLQSPKQLIGEWDKERLKRVFINLLTNAIKYTPKGGKTKVIVKKMAKRILISVADTGIGMTRQQYHSLFQPFMRQYKGEKNIEGTGLGLYISKSIIEARKGKIWVTSKKGKGSTFFVELPLT